MANGEAEMRVLLAGIVWLVVGIALMAISLPVGYFVTVIGCPDCRGQIIPVMAFSYDRTSFYVTTQYQDRPAPELHILVEGIEPQKLFLVLGGIRSCKAHQQSSSDYRDLTPSASALNGYFPLKAAGDLGELRRFELGANDDFPVVCRLLRPSDNTSYDTHIVRFVRALDPPTGSKMILSSSETYRIDQPDVDSIRFDDKYGSISVRKNPPVYSVLLASPDAIPGPSQLKQVLVTTATWTDRDDTGLQEFILLVCAALAGAGLTCFVESFRAFSHVPRTDPTIEAVS
ncbi:MAG TPA: hypothetical protein VHT05_01260 [Candidatus Elarobacter sp.]|nr:hypothetical protein [Candidatus Elarobacter sp.]